jgi:hypothetical protein
MTTVLLKANDTSKLVSWPLTIAKFSGLLSALLSDLKSSDSAADPIPLPQVSSAALANLQLLLSNYVAMTNSGDSQTAAFFGVLHKRWLLRQQPIIAGEIDTPEQVPSSPNWFHNLMTQIYGQRAAAAFETFEAAIYLDIRPLVSGIAEWFALFVDQTIAKARENPTDIERALAELRARFGVVNDFSPEEYEQVKREHMWCIAAAALDDESIPMSGGGSGIPSTTPTLPPP